MLLYSSGSMSFSFSWINLQLSLFNWICLEVFLRHFDHFQPLHCFTVWSFTSKKMLRGEVSKHITNVTRCEGWACKVYIQANVTWSERNKCYTVWGVSLWSPILPLGARWIDNSPPTESDYKEVGMQSRWKLLCHGESQFASMLQQKYLSSQDTRDCF